MTTNAESPEPNVELSFLQKKKKMCENPESSDTICRTPSLPQLVQFSVQELEVPQTRIEKISTTIKSESTHPNPPDEMLPDQREGAQPLVEGMSTTTNSGRPKSNKELSSQEMKECKTIENKELLVEITMPEAKPSLQPPLAIFGEQKLEVAQPFFEGMSTKKSLESPNSNADISCSREMKRYNRKRRRTTNESKELLEEIMMQEQTPSLQPVLEIASKQEPEVAQPFNTDAQPLVEEISTITDSKYPRPNGDSNCSQEMKRTTKKGNHKTKESIELLVERMMPEADPSLQPPLAIHFKQELDVAQPLEGGMSTVTNSDCPNSNADKQELEVAQPLNTDAQPLEGMSTVTNSDCPNSNADKQELEVAQPLNTDAQPLEGMSTVTNSDCPNPNADFNCLQETMKTTQKRNRKTKGSTELLVEIMMPEADPSLQPPLALFFEQELEVESLNTEKELKETKIAEVPSLSPLASKANVDVDGVHLHMSNSSTEKSLLGCPQKKLLVLDINGILADIVHMDCSFPKEYEPDKDYKIISGKAVFKRPFCDDFLQFCFDRFNVGVWSSRIKRNVDTVLDFLLGDSRCKLKFCWDRSYCTTTRSSTLENSCKPIVFKELRKLWENLEADLPWARGEYNESNTLLLDDSPYKALRNPVNTAIFPNSYQFRDTNDSSLGPGGDIRSYLERLAMAENIQEYVEQNPFSFGQQFITQSHPSWNFYQRVIVEETRELTTSKMKNFSGDNLPYGGLLNSASQIHPQNEVKDTHKSLITETHKASMGKYASNYAHIDINSMKTAKLETVKSKVEFERLVRDGSRDSNNWHNERGRSRIRSRSRSWSPLDSKRRKRSPWRSPWRSSRSPRRSPRSNPWRTREKRNLSPSYITRNRRSRSRSPSIRRAGEFRDDKKRQDRHHIPECANFLRGRCHRGASCRYFHHELLHKESPFPRFSAANSSYPYQRHPLPPLFQVRSAAHVPQSHRDYNQMPRYPVQSYNAGVSHSYRGPLPNKDVQFFASQDCSRTSFLPPPPRPVYTSFSYPQTAARRASSQFQQNHLDPRSDIGSPSSMRPYGPYPRRATRYPSPRQR